MFDRTAAKTELEQTRAAFQSLLHDIPEKLWELNPSGSGWPVAHEMWHLVLVQRVYRHAIQAFLRKSSYPLTFSAIGALLNLLVSYRIPSIKPRAFIAEEYDSDYDILEELLEKLTGEQWEMGGSLGGRKLTVSKTYHLLSKHFAEHAETVKKVL